MYLVKVVLFTGYLTTRKGFTFGPSILLRLDPFRKKTFPTVNRSVQKAMV